MDLVKTIIIEDVKYIKSKHFKLRYDEDYFKIADNEKEIINRLIKMIIDYNLAVKNNDQYKLTDPNRFKFSALNNYTERIRQITDANYF